MGRKSSNTIPEIIQSEVLPGADDKERCHDVNGVAIGKFAGLDDSGNALVDFPVNSGDHTLPARTTIALDEASIGRDVVLQFEEGDLLKPIIIGLVQPPEKTAEEAVPQTSVEKKEPVHVEVDGERITLNAEKEIVLRCGKASITLTKAGKVIIRGAYLLSRSSGVNRIKGGSVQIN